MCATRPRVAVDPGVRQAVIQRRRPVLHWWNRPVRERMPQPFHRAVAFVRKTQVEKACCTEMKVNTYTACMARPMPSWPSPWPKKNPVPGSDWVSAMRPSGATTRARLKTPLLCKTSSIRLTLLRQAGFGDRVRLETERDFHRIMPTTHPPIISDSG